MDNKIVDSKVYSLKELFSDKFDVDFYQREYVWQKKQMEDLIMDLSLEFLQNWKIEDRLSDVRNYDPYYMGEIVLSIKGGKRSSIIDGQQRITSLTLLLIYLVRTYGKVKNFPEEIKKLIYDDYYGEQLFNLDIEERNECMLSLYENGKREPSLDILKKIAKIFNVSTDYLLGNGQNNVEELLPKENTITVFGYGGKRRDYHLSEENAKLLEQLAEKMEKEKIDGDF